MSWAVSSFSDAIRRQLLKKIFLRIMQRMISPSWKERFFSMNLDFAEKIAGQVPILHLLCTRNPSAVYTVQREIDALEEPQ